MGLQLCEEQSAKKEIQSSQNENQSLWRQIEHINDEGGARQARCIHVLAIPRYE